MGVEEARDLEWDSTEDSLRQRDATRFVGMVLVVENSIIPGNIQQV